jgi:DNA-binding transcriptional LysR family regulator
MNIQKLDWSTLPVFAAVARSGSINAAALSLAVSPAKVARDLDELERRVGRQLLIRSTRGVELTDFGVSFLTRVETMADTFGALSDDVALAPDESTGVVTIAAYDAMATYWLARKLPEFHRSHPKVEIMLKVVTEAADVSQGEADIAILYEQPTTPNVICKQAGWVHYIPCASRGYLDVFGTPESMFDAGKHRILAHSGYKLQLDSWPDKTIAWKQVVPNVMHTNSGTVLVEDCAADGGIAILPSYIPLVDPRLVVLNFRPLASVRFWLAYSERARSLLRCSPVLAWLRDCFEPERHPWFRESYIPPRPALSA